MMIAKAPNGLQIPSAPSLVLASGSAARARLLAAAGLTFEVEAAAVDEVAVREALMAEAVGADDAATVLADLKAHAVAERAARGAIVLGADQILDLDGRWLGKPADRESTRRQLRTLRGRRHRLASAVVAYRNGGRIWHHVGSALITMRAFSDEALEAYLDAAGETALGSVGAYHLEGMGAQLIAAVRGDHFTVQGLPMLPLLAFLRDQGVLLP